MTLEAWSQAEAEVAARCADALCDDAHRRALAERVAREHAVDVAALAPLVDALRARVLELVRGVARAELEFARAEGATPADAWRAARARCEGPALRRRFALLAPLAATLECQWLDGVTRLLRRLRDDAPALARAFPGAEGAPTSIAPLASDPHDGGQTVCRLTFRGGAHVVYKPRPVDGERIVHAALGALDGVAHPLPRLAVLARGTYGWMEHAATLPPTDATPRDAWRLGAIAALAYVLGLEDLHAGNVCLTSAGPVVVDGEVCLGPSPLTPRETMRETNDERRADWPLDRWLATATHLLPRPSLDQHGRFALVPSVLDAWWPGGAARAMLPHYERGYAAVWRRLAADGGDALWRAVAPIVGEGAHVRVVLRNTATYERVRRASLRAGALYAPSAREAAIAVIAERAPESDVVAWVSARELEALERMDVPAFYMRVDVPALATLRDAALVSTPAAYPDRLALARERGARLTPGALARSRRIGRVHLRARGAELDAGSAMPPAGAFEPLAVAEAIARRLLAVAEPGRQARGDAPPRWCAPFDAGPADARLDRSAFAGSCGILLFLAAAHASGAIPDARPTLARLLADERCALERDVARGRSRPCVLSRDGLLGRCLTLAWSQRLLGDAVPAALRTPPDADAALRASARAPHRPSPRALELMDGLAGVAVARLACATPCAPDVQEWLSVAGDRLASAARAAMARRSGRPGERGLAHGLPGLCVALRRLASASGRPEWAALAGELGMALLGDALARDAARGAHPLRHSWCNGSVGLLAATRDDADAGWRALRDETVGAASSDSHTLCCGRFGLVALAAEAGDSVLDAPALARAAYASWETDGFRCGQARWYAAPALYQGVAGIGYACLMTAARTTLPSPLLLDWPGEGGARGGALSY